VTVTVESKQFWKNRESHSEVCMCGVSTQQWASTQITLFDSERTRQSVWLDAVTTPLDKKRVNSCELNWCCLYYFIKNSLVVLLEALCAVFKRIFFWGRLATKKFAKKPQQCFFRRAANIVFSKFRNLSPKKKLRSGRFLESTLRAVLINESIRGQRFW